MQGFYNFVNKLKGSCYIMRDVTVTVYKVSELEDGALDSAYYNWLEGHDYHWSGDNEKTLRAFENIFPITVNNWEYDSCSHHVRFEFDDEEIEELEGFRLARYIWNNYYHMLYKGRYYSTAMTWIDGKCYYKHRYSKVIMDSGAVLTGYFMDDEILKPVYDFLKKPKRGVTFADLMDDCLVAWGQACSNDYDHCTSQDYFVEESDNNGYEYDNQGRVM